MRLGRIRQVAVLGGAGYVGSVLVRRLLESGYGVTVMDAFVYGDEGIRELGGTAGFRSVQGDLRDRDVVLSAVRGADAVVHLGGLVGDPACALDERLTLDINLEATRVVAEAAKEASVRRFVFASSCAVYGASDQLLDERSETGPVSIYARTKVESEQVLLGMQDRRFAPVILRFGTLYGMSPRPRFDIVLNVLVARAVSDGRIHIFGGDQWRPFIHVEDAAGLVVRCLQAPGRRVKGEIFNAGSDEQTCTFEALAQEIGRAIPDLRVAFHERAPDEPNYRVSFAKVRKRLGFVPSRTLADGIREIQDALERGAIPDYLDARYSNVKSLAAFGGSLFEPGSAEASRSA